MCLSRIKSTDEYLYSIRSSKRVVFFFFQKNNITNLAVPVVEAWQKVMRLTQDQKCSKKNARIFLWSYVSQFQAFLLQGLKILWRKLMFPLKTMIPRRKALKEKQELEGGWSVRKPGKCHRVRFRVCFGEWEMDSSCTRGLQSNSEGLLRGTTWASAPTGASREAACNIRES